MPRLLAVLCTIPGLLAAQAAPSPPRPVVLDWAASPIDLTGPARPGGYVSAVGRRAVALGSETGSFEVWAWPLKVLYGFELAFKTPLYDQPIAGRDVARQVRVSPAGVTITYAHPAFTVTQRVFAPLHEPAVVSVLEVEAVRPIEIIARFRPALQYAWPAALGGQYVFWDDAQRMFVLSESRRQVNAVFGSPAATWATNNPAHTLADQASELHIAVGDQGAIPMPRPGEPAGRLTTVRAAGIPIVIAGAVAPRDSVRALYRRVLAAAESLYRERAGHARRVLEETVALRSPDPVLDLAVPWAHLNLDAALACNPDLGCGLVAGYGPGGPTGYRPGFGWYFGGDAAINSLAMVGVGQTANVRQGVLRFFARYQRADGKITHEISQSAAKIPWFTEYPYAFYHGDTTPFWILAFGEYWKQTADTALVRELWPNLRKAYDWSRATDIDGDGLMENPAAGAGALEVGDLQVGIKSDVYLSGGWVAALDRFARMAEALGHRALADSARATRATAVRTLESRLWIPSRQQYAFAVLEHNQVNESLTAWPATAMSFDVFDATRGAAMAVRLASSEIMTDWGARPLAASSRLFDPLHYNNGAVWPFVTGWVALAQYRYHNAPAGKFALDAITRTTFDESLGRNPEVISGGLYKPLDTAVPQQFFATSMVLTPLIRGLLGIEVDAPAHRLTMAPHLPPDWDSLGARNIVIAGATVDLALRRTAGGMRLDLTRRGAVFPIDVVFSPAFALGSVLDTAPAGDVHVSTTGTLRDSLTLTVQRTGPGFSLIAPRADVAIGDRSSALRVLSERLVNGQYRATLEGRAGKIYRLRVLRGGAESDTLVTFPTSGANADQYTTTTLVRKLSPRR